MISLDPKDFPGLDSEEVAELENMARQMERAAARREARRNGRARKQANLLTPAEATTYPPDPYWGTDDRGRFRYVDYDGESLHIRYEEGGDLWIDKKGEGPVYIRSEDIPVIASALRKG